MLIALASRSRSGWLGWDVRVKRSSSAESCAGDILLRVLRCFIARAAVGVGEDELASESVAPYEVPLVVYIELSDEERSKAEIILCRVAGMVRGLRLGPMFLCPLSLFNPNTQKCLVARNSHQRCSKSAVNVQNIAQTFFF